jgi:hypothetical protein
MAISLCSRRPSITKKRFSFYTKRSTIILPAPLKGFFDLFKGSMVDAVDWVLTSERPVSMIDALEHPDGGFQHE